MLNRKQESRHGQGREDRRRERLKGVVQEESAC